jgi:hypothetical protein
MGNNQDPVTLHKYLYANADSVNMIDPTGHFPTMVSVMKTVGVIGTLATTAVGAYDIYQYGTGEKEFNAVNAGWTFIILASGPVAGKALKIISLKRKQKILDAAIKSESIGKLFVKGGRTNESALRQFIPGNVKNEFIPNGNIKAGFKYKFNVAGVRIEIKWHSPDLNAANLHPGSNSGNMWTAQIKIKNKYVGVDGKLYRNNKSDKTHIPVSGF